MLQEEFMRNPFNRRLTACIVLLSLLYILINLANNGHIHYLDNGMPVSHAHPFNRSDGENGRHSHSQSQLNFYQIVTELLSFVSLFSAMFAARIVFIQIRQNLDWVSHFMWLRNGFYQRGPPMAS